MTWIIHGRCKRGSRWFWIAALTEYGDDAHKCDDPVCIYGGPHEYGWEDAEDLALKAIAEAVARLGGDVRPGCYQGNAPGRASEASGALKRLNAAKRTARPPSGETAAGVVEYLYGSWSWSTTTARPMRASASTRSPRRPPSGSTTSANRDARSGTKGR